MKRNIRHMTGLLTALFLFAIIVALTGIVVASNEQAYLMLPESYELADDSKYVFTGETPVSSFSYGESAIGACKLYGTVASTVAIDGIPSYVSTSAIDIQYTYNGNLQDTEATEWNLTSDSAKKLAGLTLSKKIGLGTVVVQTSEDGENWGEPVATVTDIFKNFNGTKDIYTISEDQLRTGTYIRVLTAYQIRQQSGKNKIGVAQYDTRCCVEVYTFYVCYAENPVILRDIISGEDISTLNEVQAGFSIDKCGDDVNVSVKKGGGVSVRAEDNQAFYTAGTYTIDVSNALGTKFQYQITVTEGQERDALSPAIYTGKENTKYNTESMTRSGNGDQTALTELLIAQGTGSGIAVSGSDSRHGIGVSGSSVMFYLQFAGDEELINDGWAIVSDKWGKREQQTVEGAQTGRIGSGALVVQTSVDGTNWTNLDYGKYANGLYTTDFYDLYSNQKEVLIYMPDGQNVLEGTYVKVIYAYELYQSSSKTYKRCIEKYEFYLCNNDLEAVTIHNLSVTKNSTNQFDEYDDATAAVYQKAETLVSGSYTVSGFTVDTSLNPTVTYTIRKNGVEIPHTSGDQYTVTGKYTVELTSALGDKKIIVIYVDRSSDDNLMQMYFGDSFISGKRIFSEGEYPVYESGYTSYQLLEIDDNHIPLSGTITNVTTGESIEISASSYRKSAALAVPGTYEAVLSTGSVAENQTLAGDCRTFTFHFEIIENGTAPGPVVNQQSLTEYATSSIAGSYPIYYGLTYSSATKGNITLAFATKEAAVDYAYSYEKGIVEEIKDEKTGEITYRYNGSFIVSQKNDYNSAWDLTDAMNYYAEQAVQQLYFDPTDDFTVLTLKDITLENTDNIRTLDLQRSVIIFADGEKEKLTNLDMLPIISDHPYSYLIPGENGYIDSGMSDFEFVSDQYGCDSYSVTITDAVGNAYPIEYLRSVGEQLNEAGCPSGIITISESTIYGDSVEYNAVFIADGKNTASVTITCYNDDGNTTQTVTQADDGTTLSTNAFTIDAIVDDLDPYSLLLVKHNDTKYVYAADQMPNDAWADPGEYTITCVNKLGYAYSIEVTVVESDYATITFEGDGTENMEYILTSYGAEHVVLPDATRYGYVLAGYEDASGNIYNDEISEITFRGSEVLNAIWTAKQFTLYMQDAEGNGINTMTIDFGKEYELPVPEEKDGYEFTCWLQNGEPITQNTITLTEEADVVLTASYNKVETSEVKSTHKGTVMIISIIIAVIIVLGLCIIPKRIKTEQDNKTMDTEKNREEKHEV